MSKTNTNPNPVATAETKSVTVIDGFRRQMQQMHPEFEKVLPKGVTVEKFVRTVITAVQTNPALADPHVRGSMLTSCMKAASDGLMPDGKESVLLIRNNKVKTPDGDKWQKEVTYQAMVAGDIKFMRQRAGVASLAARVVHQNDTYLFVYGDNERFEHTPMMAGADLRGPIIGAYVIAHMENGAIERELMTCDEIENTRGQSKQKDSLMWTKFYSEGCKKTVIKRLRKRLPGAEMAADEDEFDDVPDAVQIESPKPDTSGQVGVTARNSALQHIVDTAKPASAPDATETYDEDGVIEGVTANAPEDELL